MCDLIPAPRHSIGSIISLPCHMLERELQDLERKSDVFDKSFMIAESFRMMNNPDSSIFWYNKALEVADDELAYINLANQYKKIENHLQALQTLEESASLLGSSAVIKRELAICRQAIELKEKSDSQIELEKIGLNSEVSDFISDLNKNRLYFSSDRGNKFKNIYGWTGNFFYDIYESDNRDKQFFEPVKGNVNTEYNESSPSLSADGKTMYFVRCGEKTQEVGNCMLYISSMENGGWSIPEKLTFQKERYNYVSPRIEGNKLFFASDISGGSGGYDIYFSVKNDKGWSEPVRLPNSINTPGNENFVTFWKNEIYFSSDFLSGVGGLDIFSTTIDESGNFTPPQNIKPPFNSGADDFNLIKTSDSTGFFNSSRVGGSGPDDIYGYRIKRKFTDVITEIKNDTSAIIPPKSKKLFLAVKVVENVFAEPDDPNSKILGKKPISDVVVRIGEENLLTDANGVVLNQIPFDTSLPISVGKNSYLSHNQVFDSGKEELYSDEINTINIRIVLEKIYLDQEIVIKNIYYDFDKWDLRSESESTLNILYLILKNNPQYNVVIGSHTDCRGEDNYNLELSQKRAESVVDYLLGKGLAPDRIKAVGYGENKLLEQCECDKCTDDQHQSNRRTTFELKSGF